MQCANQHDMTNGRFGDYGVIFVNKTESAKYIGLDCV